MVQIHKHSRLRQADNRRRDRNTSKFSRVCTLLTFALDFHFHAHPIAWVFCHTVLVERILAFAFRVCKAIVTFDCEAALHQSSKHQRQKQNSVLHFCSALQLQQHIAHYACCQEGLAESKKLAAYVQPGLSRHRSSAYLMAGPDPDRADDHSWVWDSFTFVRQQTHLGWHNSVHSSHIRHAGGISLLCCNSVT